MGELALKMLREALDAFVARDVSLAQDGAEPERLARRFFQRIRFFRELLTYMLGDPRTYPPR